MISRVQVFTFSNKNHLAALGATEMINERQLEAVSNASKANAQTIIYTQEPDIKKMSALGI